MFPLKAQKKVQKSSATSYSYLWCLPLYPKYGYCHLSLHRTFNTLGWSKRIPRETWLPKSLDGIQVVNNFLCKKTLVSWVAVPPFFPDPFLSFTNFLFTLCTPNPRSTGLISSGLEQSLYLISLQQFSLPTKTQYLTVPLSGFQIPLLLFCSHI